MAIWQYTTYPIPREKVIRDFSSLPKTLSREKFDATDWWKDVTLPQNYEKVISSFLSKNSSWDKNTKVWGKEDETEISIFFENHKIVEIMIRLDTRDLSLKLLESICSFLRDCDCLIFTEDLKLIKPEVKTLVEKLKESKAFSFSKNPEEFFKILTL